MTRVQRTSEAVPESGAAGAAADVAVSVAPRQRVRSQADIVRLLASLALVVGGIGAVVGMNWLSGVLADRGVVAAVDPTTDQVVELTAPEFATSPLIAAAVAFVVIASSWLSQQWRRVLWFGIGLLILFRVVSSSEPPLDIVIAVALGMAVGYLALLAFGTDSSDPDADELVSMLRQVSDPRRIDQLGGDKPLRFAVELAGGEKLQMRGRTTPDRPAH